MTDARSIVIDPLLQDNANQDTDDLTVDEQEEQLHANDTETPDNSDDNDLPEKYRGKSTQEIIEMHRNAEKALGERNNELGQWRSLTSQLIEAKSEDDLSDDAEDELSSDDLFDDPKGAIARVVEQELQARLAPYEQSMRDQQISEAEAAFAAKHENAESLVNTTEFSEWLNRSEYRIQDAQAAAQGDLVAADRLLVDFKESAAGQSLSEAPSQRNERPSGVEAARHVATERGGTSGAISSAKTYNATDLARLINSDPRKYNSPDFQKELQVAIKEGRVKGL